MIEKENVFSASKLDNYLKEAKAQSVIASKKTTSIIAKKSVLASDDEEAVEKIDDIEVDEMIPEEDSESDDIEVDEMISEEDIEEDNSVMPETNSSDELKKILEFEEVIDDFIINSNINFDAFPKFKSFAQKFTEELDTMVDEIRKEKTAKLFSNNVNEDEVVDEDVIEDSEEETAVESSASAVLSDYNGWSNEETYSAFTNLTNDEKLYDSCSKFMRNYSGKNPYRDFIKKMNLEDEETAEGFKWNDPKVNSEELAEIMNDING